MDRGVIDRVPDVLLYHAVMYCTKGQRYQETKGAKDTWVKSSEGLLGGRVFSRTHFRSSLTPEEGPSCS